MSDPRATQLLGVDDASLARAVEILRAGGLVAFPTETVYGLGADAASPRAVAKIYAAKGRPSFNPLIAHVADLSAARREARLGAPALRLAEAFWPGPLTLVAPAAPEGSVCELARAGLASVALRIPAHPARWRCCARSAGRWRRPRPIFPAMSARSRRRMSRKISPVASTSFSTADAPERDSSPRSCRSLARRPRCCAPAP